MWFSLYLNFIKRRLKLGILKLSITFPKDIHVITCVDSFPMLTFTTIYHNVAAHLLIETHFGCFHFCARTSSAAVTIVAYSRVSQVWIFRRGARWLVRRAGWLPQGVKPLFQVVVTNLHSHQLKVRDFLSGTWWGRTPVISSVYGSKTVSRRGLCFIPRFVGGRTSFHLLTGPRLSYLSLLLDGLSLPSLPLHAGAETGSPVGPLPADKQQRTRFSRSTRRGGLAAEEAVKGSTPRIARAR